MKKKLIKNEKKSINLLNMNKCNLKFKNQLI